MASKFINEYANYLYNKYGLNSIGIKICNTSKKEVLCSLLSDDNKMCLHNTDNGPDIGRKEDNKDIETYKQLINEKVQN